MSEKKILFISHDAARTGAPMVLLHLLRWLKVNTDMSFQILLCKGGVLEPEFEVIAPVSVLYAQTSCNTTRFTRLFSPPGIRPLLSPLYFKLLKETLMRQNIGLIYANTTASGEGLEFLTGLKCSVICHVHELEYAIRYGEGMKRFEVIREYTQQYIAVSNAVKDNLIENHHIPGHAIEVIYGFIPISHDSAKQEQALRSRVRQHLNIPLHAPIVCAAGTTDWRKGADLFIRLAQILRKQHSVTPVHFVWLGGKSGAADLSELELRYDLIKLGLENSVHFLGIQPNPLDYFAASDVFVLTSREDPFPLVCLEAASVGKPIICFNKAGGASEFVEDDAGYVVPYLDVEAMAEKIVELFKSKELCRRLGQRAQQKVRQRHNIDVTAPKILHVINKFLER